MPELPEVETMRRGISGAVGCRVTDAHRYRSPQKPISTKPSWNSIARQLKGRRISRIGRHGKRLTIEFDTELTMVIEPRMTGLILIGKPPTYEHLRFEIKLSGGECDRIRYWDRRGLGKVYLLRRAQAEAYFDPRRIGPDALLLSADQLGENLGHRNIAVKVGLLDQKAVAGVGNIYASEILHLSNIDPRTKCQRITKSQWNRIHEKMWQVLELAIQYEGSTLGDGTYRNALSDPGSYQNQHRVYDRADEICLTCGEARVKRIVQAQRSTYFCPKCQPRSRPPKRKK